MEQNKKTLIKSTLVKQALKNFERNYLLFLEKSTLENYIEVKIAQKSFFDCKKNALSKNQTEFVDATLKNKYKCFEFELLPKFEEILKLRAEREQSATKLIDYLQHYEQKAKKAGKKLKYDYSALMTEYLEKLNEVELNTTTEQEFPKASYKKLPTPSKLKLTDIKNLDVMEL